MAIAPPKSRNEKVISAISYANAALTKAAAELAEAKAIRDKLASAVPEIVEACVAGERIEDTESQRTKLAEILQDPAKWPELITKIARHRATSEMPLGQPVDGHTKKASANGRQYDSLSDPRPGFQTSMVKQSDIALFRGLGLAPPSV